LQILEKAYVGKRSSLFHRNINTEDNKLCTLIEDNTFDLMLKSISTVPRHFINLPFHQPPNLIRVSLQNTKNEPIKGSFEMVNSKFFKRKNIIMKIFT